MANSSGRSKTTTPSPKRPPHDGAAAPSDKARVVLAGARAVFLAIGRLYRVLLNTAKRVASGQQPIGLDADTTAIRGSSGVLAPGVHWHTLVPSHHVQRGGDASESAA
jgi:hypothetical protein